MPNDIISNFENFLNYGPLGLAGLMLVLVVFALAKGNLSPAHERILKQFMYIGAFCFTAALAAQFFAKQSEHDLRLSVQPLGLDGADFPKPAIKANGVRVDFDDDIKIDSLTVLEVDVSAALQIFETSKIRLEAQAETLVEQDRAIDQLDRLTTDLTNDIQRIQTSPGRSLAPNELQNLNSIQRSIEQVIVPFR